ncbi:MAG TPA: hypothetical protein VGS22_01275 [Thermoanaerobaculia bacterium]|jgi:hypothetical protein|nr:hypothetical protein [Thermoanaerobaculia bacterium]
MRPPTLRRLIALAALALSAPLSPRLAAAQPLVVGGLKGGDEICEDLLPDLAVRPGGSFLLAWNRVCTFPLPETYGIEVQPFGPAGGALGPRLHLGVGIEPQVATLPDGGFVIVWDRELGPFDLAVQALRLDPLGRPLGSPVRVSRPAPTGRDVWQRISTSPDGRIAIVWASEETDSGGANHTYVRFFDSELHATSEPTLLPSAATGDEGYPDVAFAPSGEALAVWQDRLGNGFAGRAIWGRRFDLSGTPVAPEFRISVSESDRYQTVPRVIADSESGWWVAWQRWAAPSTGAAETDRDARLAHVPATGLPEGGVAGAALGLPSGGYIDPVVGLDGRGNVLLLGQKLDGALAGRLFDREGTPLSNLFDVALRDPEAPLLWHQLADRSPGDFVAVWAGDAYIWHIPIDPQPIVGYDIRGELLRAPCGGSPRAACLADGRYAVEVSWRQSDGRHGIQAAILLDDDTAVFTPDDPNGFPVAVFLSGSDLTLAATTNAEIKVRVTGPGGFVREVAKPAGRFASLRFPDILPTPVTASEAPKAGISETAGFVPITTTSPCRPSKTTLCLLGGRFRVEATTEGTAGPQNARAVPLAGRQGALTFGDAPAVLVTLVDGRPTNGRFWVYLGGLSSLPYEVKITDTTTGVRRRYVNPSGRLASRADRLAF